jgi:hypothetical protein
VTGALLHSAGALLATDFDTSTPTEIVAGQVTVMDMMQNFFEYRMMSKCGFPTITLEGTSRDWRALVGKAEALIRNRCLPQLADRWLPALLPVLQRFVAQYDDPATVDVRFWQSMCKEGGVGGSGGGTWLNGWFNVFFPYLGSIAKKPSDGPSSTQENKYCAPYDDAVGYAQESLVAKKRYYSMGESPAGVYGPDISMMPCGVAAAPVVWEYFGQKHQLQFQAGFVGAVQRDDGAIVPELGWAIVHAPSSPA